MNVQPFVKISFLSALLFFTTQVYAQSTQTNDVSNDSEMSVTMEKSKLTPEEDMKITHSVKKVIRDSKVLSKLHIDVTTTNGVVMLKGTVDSDMQASVLVENAESIVGVSDVDTSKLVVKDSQHPLDDAMITAKIKGLLIREKLFGEKDIAAINTSVETTDGVVYLSGIVDNDAQIHNAIEIIKKSVPGVKKVEYSVQKNAAVQEENSTKKEESASSND